MTKNIAVVLPTAVGTEAAAKAKAEAKTIATATGSVFAVGGRSLCEALAAYAGAAATAHASPFDLLSAPARKDRKNGD